MPGPKKNFSEAKVGDDEDIRFGQTSEYYWKYDSAAGQYELHTDDDGTGDDSIVMKVDDFSDVVDITAASVDELNGADVAGAPAGASFIAEGSGGLTAGNAREQVQYEPGVVNWAAGLSDAEIHRFDLAAGEVFRLRRVEVSLKGGGSAAGLSVDVYDAGAASVIDSASAGGGPSTTGGTSGAGNVVLVRLSNSTGSAQNASPVVRGVIE